ncbi:MAG: hypothetical protein CMF59_08140, partial [Leptospiraceae bacterium]|nr:hypothetical protein [Leptospiraceae bacterium]
RLPPVVPLRSSGPGDLPDHERVFDSFRDARQKLVGLSEKALDQKLPPFSSRKPVGFHRKPWILLPPFSWPPRARPQDVVGSAIDAPGRRMGY